MRGYTQQQIKEFRKRVHDDWLEITGKSPNFETFTTMDLTTLFELIDEHFFGGQIRKKLQKKRVFLYFCIDNTKHTRTAFFQPTNYGMRICTNKERVDTLFARGEKMLKANGIECCDRLSCLQLVLEHEIMHLILKLWGHTKKVLDKQTNKKKALHESHGELFMCMVKMYYGHTTYKSNLSPPAEILKKNFKKGDMVLFPIPGPKKDKNVMIKGKIIDLGNERVKIEGSDGKKYHRLYKLLKKM